MAYPIIYNVTTGEWEEVSPGEAEQELGVPIGPPLPASARPVGGLELPGNEPPAYYNPGARQLWASNEPGVPRGYVVPEQGDARNAASTRREAEENLSPEEIAAMQEILRANREKNFVQRITNAGDWPVVQNPDGSYSSHRMASAEVDGKNIVFPTLVYDPVVNALVQPADPVAEAVRSGEYIELPNPMVAEQFASGGYKEGLNTGLMQQIRTPSPTPMDEAMRRVLK